MEKDSNFEANNMKIVQTKTWGVFILLLTGSEGGIDVGQDVTKWRVFQYCIYDWVAITNAEQNIGGALDEERNNHFQ